MVRSTDEPLRTIVAERRNYRAKAAQHRLHLTAIRVGTQAEIREFSCDYHFSVSGRIKIFSLAYYLAREFFYE